MKLRRLNVRRMPGIDDGFVVSPLEDGLNLVVGPNGSGKSTLCRALRALLWPGLERDEAISVEATWEDGPRRWIARRDGRETSWQCDGVDVAPPPYPGESSARCFTLGFGDLLSAEAPTDAVVAREVRRQLSGGFDLHEVARAEFDLKPRHGLAEDGRLRDRRREVERVKGQQRELAMQEDEQRELERRLEAARAAAARLEDLRVAAALGRSRAELTAVRRALGDLPPGMDRLRGDELERIEELDAERTGLVDELDACRREIASAAARVEALDLARGPVAPDEIAAWAGRARALQQLETEVRAAEHRAARARARRDEAAAGLDPKTRDEARPRIDASGLGEIESFVERAGALRRERDRLAAELSALPGGPIDSSSHDLDRAIECLRVWQEAAAAAGDPTLRRGALALAACLLGASPVAVWLGQSGAAFALGLAGIATLGVLAFAGRPRTAGGASRTAARELGRLGIEPPQRFEAESVRRRIAELRERWAASALGERARDRRAELERLDAALAERERTIAAERGELRARLGLDPGCGEIGPSGLARRLAAFDRSELDLREALAARDEASAEHAGLLRRVGEFLVDHAYAAPADAAAAVAAVEDLKDRLRELESARERSRREAERHGKLEGLLAENRRRWAAVWAGSGLEPGSAAELRGRVAQRGRYLELVAEADRHDRAVREGQARLSACPDLLQLTAEDLAPLIRRTEILAEGQSDVGRELGDLDARVRAARQGQALEGALAEAAAARDALDARRDEALLRTAGRFLLDDVAAEFDVRSRPRVLARAMELFARFTHHRYELKLVPGEGPPAFRAVEVEAGAGRSLAELSDATRVQLLLAARLAYVAQVDREAGLPLVLDEVLTTSDPERFVAVAGSVLGLAREEGRQVLYLTADPADLVRWNRVLRSEGLEAVAAVDLGQLRGSRLRVDGKVDLEVPPLPEVPAPGSLGAEAYGELLGVPRVDLDRQAASLHLFHLLRDDLPLLHVLLTERVQTVGQWRQLASAGAAARLVGERAAERVSALCDLAEELALAWRVGRGRPVDASVLRRAGIDARWTARLESLLRELDGDAARLLEALGRRDDERTRGFQSRVREKLRAHLARHGHLDEREKLDEAALHTRVRAAVAAHIDRGLLRPEDVSMKVHELYHQGRVHA